MKRPKLLFLATFLVILVPAVFAWQVEGSGEVKIEVYPENGKHYYDREAAVNYAQKYAYNRNGDYPDFGEKDCTNFISQALVAGGWQMQKGSNDISGNWFSYKREGKRAFLLEKLEKIIDDLFRAVDYPKEFAYDYSETWSSVTHFWNFIRVSGRGEKEFYAYSKDKLDQLIKNDSLKIGDIVQVDWTNDGTFDHSMIIVNIDKNKYDIGVAYHSNDKNNISLKDLMNEDSSIVFRFYHLRDYY